MSLENNFTSLGLVAPLLRAITDAGYTQATPIQLKAIPMILEGRDLLAAAQTGTGKTAGFMLPVLQRLMEAPAGQGTRGRPRCLILTPTRELAAQVQASAQTYGKHLPITSMAMFGGVGIHPQIQQLRGRVDILVATPGRLLDHAQQRTVDLSRIEILVLDEADRMLDMGFIPDIKRILALLPAQRQNLLFSATFTNEIRELAGRLLDHPAQIEVAPRNAAAELVEQSAYIVPRGRKRELLIHLIRQQAWPQVLVFTRTKHGANALAERLVKAGIAAMAIHGNKSQAARTRALAEFKAGNIPVLVATDIAARGLDIDQLPQVVNFDLPQVPEDYVHRIGRTGRAGSTGAAVSLVEGDDVKLLAAIERLIGRTIPKLEPVDFVPSTETPSEPARARAERPPRRETTQRAPMAREQEPRRGHRAGAEGAPRSEQRRNDNGRPQQRAGGVEGGNRAPRSRPAGNWEPRRAS